MPRSLGFPLFLPLFALFWRTKNRVYECNNCCKTVKKSVQKNGANFEWGKEGPMYGGRYFHFHKINLFMIFQNLGDAIIPYFGEVLILPDCLIYGRWEFAVVENRCFI